VASVKVSLQLCYPKIRYRGGFDKSPHIRIDSDSLSNYGNRPFVLLGQGWAPQICRATKSVHVVYVKEVVDWVRVVSHLEWSNADTAAARLVVHACVTRAVLLWTAQPPHEVYICLRLDSQYGKSQH
jgi:hypothetical protein